MILISGTDSNVLCFLSFLLLLGSFFPPQFIHVFFPEDKQQTILQCVWKKLQLGTGKPIAVSFSLFSFSSPFSWGKFRVKKRQRGGGGENKVMAPAAWWLFRRGAELAALSHEISLSLPISPAKYLFGKRIAVCESLVFVVTAVSAATKFSYKTSELCRVCCRPCLSFAKLKYGVFVPLAK